MGGGALCLALVWGGLLWRQATAVPEPTLPPELAQARQTAPTLHHPFIELLKLVSAALIGIVVTAVHKRYHHERPLTRSLEQAQILLCVAGALIMIIIGNSLARAFGVAGAAGIVRFRTPVEDPKDTTVIFLLLGLGMSCGLGAFAVAGLGTVFLCAFLAVLDQFGERRPRIMMLELVASGPEFPTAHVHDVLARSVHFYEAREVAQGDEATVKYHVTLDPSVSLSYLSQQLVGGGTTGIKSVSWVAPKKGA